MQLIKPNYKIIKQKQGIQGIYEQAELPGRICYGSQDKIAPGTAEKFIKGLMQSNHGAPLEHNGVYLDCPHSVYTKYVNNKYSKTSYHKTGETYTVPYKGYLEEVTKYYWHSIGHSLGLDTHDLDTPDRDTVFKEGMVWTVEPGIYIEEESIGIRIEDDVLVTSDGVKVLTDGMIKTVEEIEEFMKRRRL